MPPKKSKKAAKSVPSLESCAVTLGATTLPKDVLGGKPLKDLKDEIIANGGTYVTKIEEATHMVLTESQFKKSSKKIEEAKTNNIHIVSYDWLEEALSASAPVDEKDYSHLKSTSVNGNFNGRVSKDDDQDDDADTKATSTKKRKRKAEEDDEDSTDIKRATVPSKAMNVTKKSDLQIPLDEVLMRNRGNGYKVYIDDDSVIYDVTLNQSDSGANANKFYRMQLLRGRTNSYSVWTRWGRVGEDGQNKMVVDSSTLDAAMNEFYKKFKDKTGNLWEDRATGPMKAKKYVFVERSYDDSDDEEEDVKVKDEVEDSKETVESKLAEPVQRLLKLIFNQELFDQTFDQFSYDAKKMPLGKLSKSSLMRGYEVLKTLSTLVGNNSGNRDEITSLSNQYLSLIPHVVSRSSRPPVMDDMQKIKNEIELLEALTDMQLANDLMKTAKKKEQSAEEVNLLDRQFQGLGLQEMEPISSKSTEFRELEAYLTKSVGHTHGTNYKIQDIFRIQRNGEFKRFDTSEYANIPNKNRRLLWHGSRVTNFGGILSQGLRIAPPEAPVSGYMFGKGVYLADMSSKSAGYTASYSSGGTGLLLLCEAELGEPPLKLSDSDYNAGDRAKAENCLSTWGVGRTAPQAWKDAKCVHPNLEGISMPDVISKKPGPSNEQAKWLEYNEYIVYDVAQIKLRYLFRVMM